MGCKEMTGKKCECESIGIQQTSAEMRTQWMVLQAGNHMKSLLFLTKGLTPTYLEGYAVMVLEPLFIA